MNKYFIIPAVLTLMTVIGNPSSSNAQTLLDTSAATNIGTAIDSGPTTVAPGIREKIRTDYEAKIQNLKANQEVRKEMVETKKPLTPRVLGTTDDRLPKNAKYGSTTPQQEARERIENRLEDRRNASTSIVANQAIRKEYLDNGRSMLAKQFQTKKAILVRQFETAIKNLTNLSTRINARIVKEQATGRDLSEAVSLMKTAQLKIGEASTALKTLQNYSPMETGTGTTSASIAGETKINLETARQLIATTQKTITEARKALNAVVVSIAHSMGLKLNQGSTTTSTQSI